MREDFLGLIAAIAASPVQHNVIAIGFFDGLIKCCVLDRSPSGKLTFSDVWLHRLKKGVRGLCFSDDGSNLYAIGENRALVVLEVAEGKRLRCIRRSYENTKPHRLVALPQANRYVAATGADNGEIAVWDFNSADPIVATFHDQTDSINALEPFKTVTLLAASSDATLAAYDFRQRKLRVQSETLNCELLSITVLNKFTCVGSGDGTIELFNNAEFGNIMGRVKTSLEMGVDAMIELESDLLIAGSNLADELKFFKVHPNKTLASIPHEGGVDMFVKTCDSKYLIFSTANTKSVYVRRLADVLLDATADASAQKNAFVFD